MNQMRRSNRIKSIKDDQMESTRKKITDLSKQIKSHTIFEMRIQIIMEIYTTVYTSFNLHHQYMDDAKFSEYMYAVFVKGLYIKNNIRKFIELNSEKNTLQTKFMVLFTKIYNKMMNYFRSKIDALTKKVWLNDDVVYLIYSYM